MQKTGLRTLYSMRADLRRHRYDPAPPSADLATLIEVIDRDQYCAFFG